MMFRTLAQLIMLVLSKTSPAKKPLNREDAYQAASVGSSKQTALAIANCYMEPDFLQMHIVGSIARPPGPDSIDCDVSDH